MSQLDEIPIDKRHAALIGDLRGVLEQWALLEQEVRQAAEHENDFGSRGTAAGLAARANGIEKCAKGLHAITMHHRDRNVKTTEFETNLGIWRQSSQSKELLSSR